MRVTTAGNQIDAESPEVLAGPCCASVLGVNVHAGVCVPARDRVRLSREIVGFMARDVNRSARENPPSSGEGLRIALRWREHIIRGNRQH
jgi:hypothetical protein